MITKHLKALVLLASLTAVSVASPIRASAAPADVTLAAVSCVASSCTAVGSAAMTALAERWNGTRWSVQALPKLAGRTSSLVSVSCPLILSCFAVGSYNFSGRNIALVERWTGSRWTPDTFDPASSPVASLSAIACAMPTNCVAVGNYVSPRSRVSVPFAETFAGGQWRFHSMPEPASGPVVASPFSVSCVSVKECIAVGAYEDGDHTFTLAEVWNGASWAVSSTRDPVGRYARLTGVSCVWGDCEAVGWYTAGPRNFTVAERRAGSNWATKQTAHLPGLSVLEGVSCRTILFCTAVGDHNAELPTRGPFVLVEHWNGSTWATQNVPGSPMAGAAPVLLGVSCPSIVTCMAVGDTDNRSGGQAAVAANWVRGKWSFIPVPG